MDREMDPVAARAVEITAAEVLMMAPTALVASSGSGHGMAAGEGAMAALHDHEH